MAISLLLALGGWAVPAHTAAPESDPIAADWIWSSADRSGESILGAWRSFEVPGEIRSATLRVVGEFASLQVHINGKPVIQLDAFDTAEKLDVTRSLVTGANRMEVSATAVPGPSAIAMVLTILSTAGDSTRIASDTQWQATDAKSVISLGQVEAHRWQDPLPDITPFAEYNQWKEALVRDGQTTQTAGSAAADAKLSSLPPGFEIMKIRDALEGEDSWISMTIDPRGRLIIGKEQQGLLRLTPSEDRDRIVHAERINETLGECRGLLWHGDSLYVHANRDHALMRLRDTDGDDRFDEVTKQFATIGGTGHGRNDLAAGPDGAIHAIVGDDIEVPQRSPRRARPEAGAAKELGHWARLSEASGDVAWEAMNRGLRNPYGIDFNVDGEAFTYDADNEGDVGLPFYRPTRINHLVSGANYGWHQQRDLTRSLPVYAPDSVPTNLDLGRGSPTAVKFGTHSHFPAPWREALFVLDWAYGRMIAVHLTPCGASYVGHAERFLEGRPLNVTDLDFDPDGSMWFITGGRKTHSALYRIRYTGAPVAVLAAASEQSRSRATFSARARALRQWLERFHGRVDAAAVEQAWPHLGDADPWIRGAARIALEWQPVDRWRSQALDAGSDLAGLTARLALARAGTVTDRSALANAIATIEPKTHWSRIEKLTLLRVAELAGVPTDSAAKTRSEAQTLALTSNAPDPVAREVARRLISLQSPHAVSFALERLASAEDQLERLHYLEALSEASVGWTRQQRQHFFTALAYAKRFSYGDRFMPAFFEAVQRAALENVRDSDERAEMAERLAQDSDSPAAVPAPRPLVRHWTVAAVLAADSKQTAGESDLKRGHALFAAAMCASCHVCGVEGRPVGPDLTTVGRRFTRREVLESIVEPSKVIAEGFRNVVVLQNDGTTSTGRIVQNDFRESKLVLATSDLAASQLQSIPKAAIESWSESPVSPMPTGLLDSLTHAEINDLLAYLLAEGRVP